MTSAIYLPATWAYGPCLAPLVYRPLTWNSTSAYSRPPGTPLGASVVGLFYGKPRAVALPPGVD